MRGAAAADHQSAKKRMTVASPSTPSTLLKSVIDGVSPAISMLQGPYQPSANTSAATQHRRPFSALSDPPHKLVYDATSPTAVDLPVATPVPTDSSATVNNSTSVALEATVAKKLPMTGEIARLLVHSTEKVRKTASAPLCLVPKSFEPVVVPLRSHAVEEQGDSSVARMPHRSLPSDASLAMKSITPMQLISLLRQQRMALRQIDEEDLQICVSAGPSRAQRHVAASMFDASHIRSTSPGTVDRPGTVDQALQKRLKGAKIRPMSSLSQSSASVEQQAASCVGSGRGGVAASSQKDQIMSRVSRISSAQVSSSLTASRSTAGRAGLPPIGPLSTLSLRDVMTRKQPQNITPHLSTPHASAAKPSMGTKSSALDAALGNFPVVIGASVKEGGGAMIVPQCRSPSDELPGHGVSSSPLPESLTLGKATTTVGGTTAARSPSADVAAATRSPTIGVSQPLQRDDVKRAMSTTNTPTGMISRADTPHSVQSSNSLASPTTRPGSYGPPRPMRGRGGGIPPRPASGGSLGAWDSPLVAPGDDAFIEGSSRAEVAQL